MARVLGGLLQPAYTLPCGLGWLSQCICCAILFLPIVNNLRIEKGMTFPVWRNDFGDDFGMTFKEGTKKCRDDFGMIWG